MPFGSVVPLERTRGAGAITIEYWADAVFWSESFACTVKLKLPATVGVPLICPLLWIDTPVGKTPPLKL
jgi:hypothetical protein